MAKELPYFKFEPNQWENGNIQMCSREAKGLFIDLCSSYWSRLGELPYALALQKHCNGIASVLQELINNEIIIVLDGQIVIEFMDEQLNEFQETSGKRRDAANKRWKNANALQVQCKSNAIREEKRREEEIKKKNTASLFPSFDDFWIKYDKQVGRKDCESEWDKIKQNEKEAIMQHLDPYILSTPEKAFRKNPLSYLNQEAWSNEIITKNQMNNEQFTNIAKSIREQYPNL